MGQNYSSALEDALASCLKQLQDRITIMCKGREKDALIALTRALDCTTTYRYWDKALGITVETEQKIRREMILRGSL